MTPENHTLFDWNTLDEYSDLKRLQMVFTSLPAGGLLDALCHMRSGGGRNDWPLQPMLKACIARIVYQHPSVESFRRELQRNPSLMLACGFKLMACHNDPQRYRVPSKSAFSRFNRLMNRAERDFGAVSDMFDSLVKQVSQLLPDFGTHQGFDGKALKSHSTGNDIPGKGRTSDPDARWGKHEYHYTDQKGRAQKKVKSWFGYKLYLQADVRYELPIAFSLKPANETEIKECKELVSNMLENELAERCKSFVADKGLDADELRKIFYRHGVTTAIDVRRMWQEEAVDGLRYPTRSLNEDRVDTMIHDEVGTLYCKCPETGKVRQMSYYGLERKRGTQKFHCPVSDTGEVCAGREECHRLGGVRQDAKRRIVRIKINEDKLRTFAALPRHTYRWKRHYKRRSALERINARVGRDFQLERHYMRGLETMQMRVALSLSVMLAMACTSIREGQSQRMRSLILPLAA